MRISEPTSLADLLKNRIPVKPKKEKVQYDFQILALEICEAFKVDDYRIKGAIMAICGKHRDNLEWVRKQFADTKEMAPKYAPSYFLKISK